MKIYLIISIILIGALSAFAQYNDPNFPKPASGYGSDGIYTVGVGSFTNPDYPEKNIEIYYPYDFPERVPTLFYSHAYGGNNASNISGLLNFVAKKGYAIVFVPYQTTGVTVEERYNNLLNGFRLTARSFPSIIDTTRVGFLGYSFGGGASFANAYKCFTENNWGQNGRFIYTLAPWYSYNITQAQLKSFPADTKLLMEVFDDDTTNDHRMAIDIFNTINIPSGEKDYILLKSDTVSGYIYAADHTMPNTSAAFDALDYFAYYRLLDALCDYTFNKNTAAKQVALGNGSSSQVTMPVGLKKLVQSDNPNVSYPESKYRFPCSSIENLRKNYCPATADVEPVNNPHNEIKVYPNPFRSTFVITDCAGTKPKQLSIFNAFGCLIASQKINNCTSIPVDLSAFPQGLYILKLDDKWGKIIKQ